ncbi:hypothetical protein EMCRGX_G010522 [Ephydatia muelleri]
MALRCNIHHQQNAVAIFQPFAAAEHTWLSYLEPEYHKCNSEKCEARTEGHYIGVRSGMEDQSSEVQAPTTPSNSRTPSGQAQVVRMSLRPPSRFSAGADLVLWRKRFELYARQAKIAEDQWTARI